MIKKFAKQLLHSVKIAKETYVWEDLNDQVFLFIFFFFFYHSLIFFFRLLIHHK